MTRPNLHIVEPDEPAPPKAPIEPTHVTFQPAARHAFTSLEGRVGQLRRIFAGPSASITAAAEIERLCADIMTETQRVRRLAK
jgi:hypothetical protein